MNKLLPLALTSLILGIAVFTIPVTRAQTAASVSLSPTTVSVQQNNSFIQTVTINTGSSTAQVSDVTIRYAANDLDVSVSGGTFFPGFASAVDKSAGIIELHGYTTTPDGISGSGTLATLSFKAKKNSGSSTITFICSGTGHDTNILSTTGQNVLSCTQTNQTAVSYTGASNPASTPTPTQPAGVTPTPTPTPTPVPGNNTYPVCVGLTPSVSSAVGSPLAVTFSCSGVDTDGYINAAHFDFGDGSGDTIEKNAGSPGTITTTHTYTTIGALGASCWVRDNNNVWSSVPSICKTIITIHPKVQYVSSNNYPVYQYSTNPEIQYVQDTTTPMMSPTPTPIPTMQLVSIVEITPTPEETPVLTPSPTTAPVQAASGTGIGWAILAVAAIGVGYILFRNSRRSQGNP